MLCANACYWLVVSTPASTKKTTSYYFCIPADCRQHGVGGRACYSRHRSGRATPAGRCGAGVPVKATMNENGFVFSANVGGKLAFLGQ